MDFRNISKPPELTKYTQADFREMFKSNDEKVEENNKKILENLLPTEEDTQRVKKDQYPKDYFQKMYDEYNEKQKANDKKILEELAPKQEQVIENIPIESKEVSKVQEQLPQEPKIIIREGTTVNVESNKSADELEDIEFPPKELPKAM